MLSSQRDDKTTMTEKDDMDADADLRDCVLGSEVASVEADAVSYICEEYFLSSCLRRKSLTDASPFQVLDHVATSAEMMTFPRQHTSLY